MQTFMIAAIAALAFAGAAGAAPHCVKGKVCGNSCIKVTDVCHKGTTAPATPTASPAKPPTPAKSAAKHCKDPKTHSFVKCTAPGAVPV